MQHAVLNTNVFIVRICRREQKSTHVVTCNDRTREDTAVIFVRTGPASVSMSGKDRR
jgi:hypothetical protein